MEFIALVDPDAKNSNGCGRAVELVLLDAGSRLARVSARPDVPEDIHIPR